MVAKILVAEDQPDTLVLMLHQLKGRGYRTLFATDGGEAVRLAEEEQPDLIICQWRFSTPEGRPLALRLLGNRPPAQVKLVALFDAAPMTPGGWATPSGCVGHLVKPLAAESFLAAIERHIPPAARPLRLPVHPVGQRRRSDWA